MNHFESFLASQIERYLEYRINHGYAKKTTQEHLSYFDRYLLEKKAVFESLQPPFFLEMRSDLTIEARSINRIIASVRVFFNYLVRQGYCQANPLQDIPYLQENTIIPFVFSQKEIELLLTTLWTMIRRTQKRFFLKDFTDYLAIVLLARCGLRISEPLKMRIQHYNPIEKTLYVEKTKFKKDRLIPVPFSVAIEIENYLSVRNTLLPAGNENPFLLVSRGLKSVYDQRVRYTFHRVVNEIGLARPRHILGGTNFSAPTPHSLRHSFAVNTLKRIKEQGGSPQNALPVLADYMGHSMYRHTVKYLKVLDADHHRNLLNFAVSHSEQK